MMEEIFTTEFLCNEKKCSGKGHSCHFPHNWLHPYPLYRVKYIYYLMFNLLPIDVISLVIFDKETYILHIEIIDLTEYY